MGVRKNQSLGLFPLSLSPLEKFFYSEATPLHPFTFVRQIIFSGEVDRRAFEAALNHTLERHPLLKALIDSPQFRSPRWLDGEGLRPWLDWAAEDEPLEFNDQEYIDLTREPGFRVWVRQGPETATLTFQFHHACTDGIGAMQVLGDLIKSYHNFSRPNEKISLPSLRLELLKQRKEIKSRRHGPCQQRFDFLYGLSKYKEQFFQKPSELMAVNKNQNGNGNENSYPRLVSRTFSAGETHLIRDLAKKLGGTLNDLLLRDLFLTLREWNEQYAEVDWGRYIRILMPINLRSQNWEGIPAANLLSFGFLTQLDKKCDRNEENFEKLKRNTKLFRQTTAGREFLNKMTIAQSVPGLFPLMQRLPVFHVTAILSNLGDVTAQVSKGLPRKNGTYRAGNLSLESVRGCPPLRHKTHAAFHIMTYLGKMTITATCAPRFFSMKDTKNLLSRFVFNLRQSLKSFN